MHPQPSKIRRVAQVDNVPDALVAAQQNAKANNCQSLKPQPGSKNGWFKCQNRWENIRKHKHVMLHDGHIRICPVLFSILFDGGWWWLVNPHPPNQKAVEAAVGSWGLLKISQDFGIMYHWLILIPWKPAKQPLRIPFNSPQSNLQITTKSPLSHHELMKSRHRSTTVQFQCPSSASAAMPQGLEQFGLYLPPEDRGSHKRYGRLKL